MDWNSEAARDDFLKAARLAGVEMASGDVLVEELSAPHRPPTRLPTGKMAVYVFTYQGHAMKVGKAGSRSGPRYTSHHYNPGSAPSTLADSILADKEMFGRISSSDVGDFIKREMNRVNFLLDEGWGKHVLTLLEAFLQCRLRPRYEGFKSQRG